LLAAQSTNQKRLSRSFDHLVGAGEEGRWDGEAERLGGREVNNEIEFGGLFDRNISWLRPM